MNFLKQNAPSLTLLIIAALFLVVGVWREETEQVFRKAVNFCME